MRVVNRLVENIQQLSPIVTDGAIGAGIFAIGSLELVLSNDPASRRPSAWVLLSVGALGLTLRRTKLSAAYALVLLAAIGGLITNVSYWGTLLPDVVLLYTVSERSSVIVSLLALVAAFGMRFLAFGYGQRPTLSDVPYLIQTDYSYLFLAWFAGRAQMWRRAIASELEQSADELRDERDRLVRGAVRTERARIALELHALVVRGVERMNTETQAARRLLASDSRRASEQIGAIEATGRGTLVDMRRLLLVLRTRDDLRTSPLADVSPRAERAAGSPSGAAGLPRTPSLMGRRRNLAPGLRQRVRAWIGLPWVTDALVVLALTILAVAEPFSKAGPMHGIHIVLAVVVLAALLFRRVAPLGVLALVAGVVLVQNRFLGLDTNTADRAIFVAVYTVAALRGPRWGVVAIGAEVVAYAPYLRDLINAIPLLVGWTALFVFAVIAGTAVRESRRLTAELREQTDLLRRTREERVRRAVDEERSRIARDVHDMVAHGVTLMVIQAGAARWLAEGDPVRAEQALRSVEQAGQDAICELHSLVGSLEGAPSGGAEALPLEDQLTIGSLVDEAIRTGMNVDLVIRGDHHELGAGVQLSLYRIVQEALTNVRKHALGARTWVEIRYTREGVEVEVTDAGGPSTNRPEPVPGSGQGLVGIAERAALFGGLAEIGPTPEGGFRVRASLADDQVLV
jgi:signal transduction histidine kinase